MSRPDIAIVAPYPSGDRVHAGPSGVASYTANLCRALAQRGATVHVVAPQEPDAVGRQVAGSITVDRVFRRGPLALARACDAALRSGAPTVHVQHEHFIFGGLSSVSSLLPALDRLRRRQRGPVVTMHQVVEPAAVDREYTRLHRVAIPAPVARVGLVTLQRSVAKRAGACIVHEPRFAESVPGALVIPHGIEGSSAASQSDAQRELGLHDDRLIVLCFGFVAPYKGLELALAAAKLAVRDVRLVVAGGEHPRLAGRDDYAEELRRANPHATFTGYVPDDEVALWFRAADVALLTHPRPHGSSGALALAIANRTPVLLSEGMAAVTGAPRALVAPDEPNLLAERLRGLSRHESERDALRAAVDPLRIARGWGDVAEAHLALYEEVRACPWR